MAGTDDRTFEITATVNFPTVAPSDLGEFATKLESAVVTVLSGYPAVTAYYVAADLTGDVIFGLRFEGIEPVHIEGMADDILEEAVDLVAQRDGTRPLESEREESVLVLA